MQTESTIRVEFGAWVEGTVAKKNGQGMRKVWVSPAPKGESERMSVIRTRDGRDTHVLTLHVDEAPDVLQAAVEALTARFTAPAPAPAKAPAAPKAPTPPAPSAAQKRAAAVAQARANKPASAPRVVAPTPEPTNADLLDWLDAIRA